MEIRQLEYFLVLCEELNYTRAAARLYLTRQALRQSIAALETELCGPLLHNVRNHLTLTEQGESLQRHAAPVVAQFRQMQRALDAEISSAAPIRFGISVALIPDYLPDLEHLLDQFQRRYPRLALVMRQCGNDEVADNLENGALDAGLVMDMGVAAPGLLRTALRKDPACVMIAPKHSCWEWKTMPLAALKNECLLVPGQRPDAFAPLQQACLAQGFTLKTEIGLSFYQVNYLVQEQHRICLNRYEAVPRRTLDRVRDLPLEGVPPLYAAFLQPTEKSSAGVELLRRYLRENLAAGVDAMLPAGR